VNPGVLDRIQSHVNHFIGLLFVVAVTGRGGSFAAEPPTNWVDPDTGHRVIRISTQPNSASLYFHQNTYTPEGDKMIFSTPRGIAVVDLKTLASGLPKIELVVSNASPIAMAWKSREVYFRRQGVLHAANVDTRAVREVFKGRALAVNCDETFVVSTINAEDPTGKTPKPEPRIMLPQRERMFPGRTDLTGEEEASARKEDRLARRLTNQRCMAFVFTNLKTGQSVTNGYQYAWLNHIQFSPTEPNLLLYCHEGTWHEVDRIWTIRTDGTQQQLRHKRTMDLEIAGHEFWSHDGQTIWFDLQTPRSQEFWLAGLNVGTGKTTRYKLERDWWSVHYNISRDGRCFAGDGGDPGQVAFAKDGMWINLFTPQPEGTIKRERLVNMSKQDYYGGNGEPNVSITPDGKWVVFRSNMHGPTHVYAVEIAKAIAKN
jgi:oligogalacturonide lyase